MVVTEREEGFRWGSRRNWEFASAKKDDRKKCSLNNNVHMGLFNCLFFNVTIKIPAVVN